MLLAVGGATLGTAAVAIADIVDADVIAATSGNQVERDLGTVAAGGSVQAPVSFQLRCDGKKHVDSGQTVIMGRHKATLDGDGVGTAVVNATLSNIGAVPTAWPDDTTGSANCGTTNPLNDNGDSTVTITAPATAGAHTVVVTYKPTFDPVGSDDNSDLTSDTTSVTFTFTVASADRDGDGVNDGSDNCPDVSNANQADLDGDGQGDACDSDIDGDGTSNASDAFPRDASETRDSDGDDVGDNADAFDNDATESRDGDGDGVGDNGDNCATVSNPGQADADRDGKGAECDENDAAPALGTVAADAPGNEGDTLRSSGSFTDADGNHTLTITKNSGAGTVTDNGNGTWSWSHSPSDDGSGTVQVQASDGEHTAVVDEFEWSAANIAPTTPGKPALSSSSANPNKTGQFTLNWDASEDVPGDTVTYTLTKMDADDDDYSTVASGLESASYTFAGANAAAEGTWTYKVQATDGETNGASAASDPSDGVKVDKSAPTAPAASTNPAAPVANSGGWFKDSVTVSYGDSSDPKLADGSAGSGIPEAGYTASQTFNTTGSHTYSGKATDNAGNDSTATTGTVQVDASNPTVAITAGCPTGPVVKGSSQSLTVTASDTGSDLKSNPGGTVALDTSAVGSRTHTIAVEDKVGHTGQATCTYSVIYNWTGFFQPIDNKDGAGNYILNKAKAGSTIPVKFSLGGNQGMEILNGTPGTGAIACSTTAASDALEEYSTATTSGLKYDAAADQYIYNWKTATSFAGTCRQLIVKLADGKDYRANFTFVK